MIIVSCYVAGNMKMEMCDRLRNNTILGVIAARELLPLLYKPKRRMVIGVRLEESQCL